MKKAVLVLILITLSLVFAGCNGNGDAIVSSPTPTLQPTSSPEAPATPTPTEEPTATVTPTPIVQLQVHFIDVGQGDSILADLGEIEILIDGGRKSNDPVEYLKPYLDGPLEVMVATHPHADHIGGLIKVLDEFDVLEIWHNGDSSTSKTYGEFMDAIDNEGATVHVARIHDTIEAGELSFYVLHPAELGDDTNNNSIVLHLRYGEVDFLFTGDAEEKAEGEMMIRSSVPVPNVDILKVGHHGSSSSSSLFFLQLTSPEVAIYMCAEGNSYEHPHEETISKLTAIGAEIYGTDVNGTILVTTNGIDYSVRVAE